MLLLIYLWSHVTEREPFTMKPGPNLDSVAVTEESLLENLILKRENRTQNLHAQQSVQTSNQQLFKRDTTSLPLGQLKEQTRFLVSRSLTLPSAPPCVEFDDISLYTKKQLSSRVKYHEVNVILYDVLLNNVTYSLPSLTRTT